MAQVRKASLSGIEQRMHGVKDQARLSANVTSDEATGAIKSSLDRGAGYATPLIAAGIELDHVGRALQQIVSAARTNASSSDAPHVVGFLKYAVPVVGKVREDVVRAVGKAGGYVNLGNGIQTLMGKDFLGIPPANVRWYIEQGNIGQLGSRVSADIAKFTIVGHYTDILGLHGTVQNSAAYHAEFTACASRGKTSCATIDDKCTGAVVNCTNLSCGLYQACQDKAYSSKAGSGAPKGGCDERHAKQGLVVGSLAQLDLMGELGKQAELTRDKLTANGKQAYGVQLSAIASSAGLLQTAFGKYMNELKPVLTVQKP